MNPVRTLVLLSVLSLVGLTGVAGCKKHDGQPAAKSTAGQRTITVAAAADLKFAFEEVAAEFQKLHPDIKIQATYGSSGNFFEQLTNKAPFDLFLSADMDYPRKLVEQGLAEKDSEFLYGVGRMVVWAPKQSKLDLNKLGLAALLDPSVKKIAIANPKHAPYGRAAVAALVKLGVYDQVKDKLVLGENIAQTAQFVQSGAADVGIVALSLALAPAMKDAGRYWEIPLDDYPLLEQGGVILSSCSDKDATGQLCNFITSAAGQAILNKYGFSTPGD
jgi:molybdate transport system substrate-binding protein